MSWDPLPEFLKDIELYRPIWQSARISGLILQANGRWISLGLRVSLSELAPQKLQIVYPYNWFAYFDGRCPIGLFDTVAEELVHGRYLTVQSDYSATRGAYVRVYLNRSVAEVFGDLPEETFQLPQTPNVPAGPTWSYPGLYERGSFPVFYGTDRARYALSANGKRTVDILSQAEQQRVDGKLRGSEPAFDGLEGLISKLLPGLPPQIGQGDAQFQIVAPLPFFLEHPEPTGMKVRAPSKTPRGALGVRFFFRPGQLSPSSSLGLRPEIADNPKSGMIEWTVDIPWPEESVAAKACLFFSDREIDSLEMNRWTPGASLRTVLDDYFDPGRDKLLKVLGLDVQDGQSRFEARQFEAAVARLMSLLGVPLIWYGDSLAKNQRPDLGGLIELLGKKVAILGECTLVKPDQKFSELHIRADELATKIGTEAEVIAAVFTSAHTTRSEAQHAAEHQIALVGRDELQQLLNLLQSPTDPSKVVELLRKLMSNRSGLSALPLPL